MITGPQQLHVTIDVAVLDPQEGLAAELDGGAGRRMVRDSTRTLTVTLDPPVTDAPVQIEILATCKDVSEPHDGWTARQAVKIPQPARVHRATGRVPRTM